jgi:hypothetical protein
MLDIANHCIVLFGHSKVGDGESVMPFYILFLLVGSIALRGKRAR